MLQYAAKTLNLDRTLYFDGYSFGLVRNKRQVTAGFVQNVDALIVQVETESEARAIVQEIRLFPLLEDYLKPVFLSARFSHNHKLLQEFDGVADPENLSEAAAKTAELTSKIERLSPVIPSGQGMVGEVLVKAVQFGFTRHKNLAPVPNSRAKLHYQFPFVSTHFEENEEQKVLEVFKLGEKQGWLTGKLVDKVHVCPECSSAHQNLRATCPKCRSIDITEQDLVHHFPCAHIAPMSDFQKKGGDGLHCPKCDKGLRHIGNDYDKPASIHNCNACGHTFQQAEFRSFCIDCNEDLHLHRLEEVSICQYELTAKATAAVQNGSSVSMGASFSNPGRGHGVFEFDVFKVLIRQEVLRRREKGQPGAFVGQVKMDGIPVQQFSSGMEETLKGEVCDVIKSYLKPSDVVSSKGARHYYFMLTDSDAKTAEKVRDVLSFNLNKLLHANLGAQAAKVQIEVEALVK